MRRLLNYNIVGKLGAWRSSFTLVSFSFVLMIALSSASCGKIPFLKQQNSDSATSLTAVDIPIRSLMPSERLNLLELPPTQLDLLSTNATALIVSVTGCASGYTATSVSVTSSVRLYIGDKNCLVKLESFTLTSTYQPTGVNSTPFTTWAVNDTAKFQSTTLSTDVYNGTVLSQVTAGGVTSSDTVVYSFVKVSSLTTVNQAQSTVGVTVAAPNGSSFLAPNYDMVQARYLGIDGTLRLKMSFTLQCGNYFTGSSAATYACDGMLVQSQLDYIFIADTYSGGQITYEQITTAFTANTPVTPGSLIVAPGGVDLNNNGLPNGGFYTSNASPLLTGIYPSAGTSYVLMLRHKDSNSKATGYLYFYISIPTFDDIAVNACGAYFNGGSGTGADPYRVSDYITLRNVEKCQATSYFFIQTQNIDMSNVSWTPIVLYGQYNGNSFSVTGLTVNLFRTISIGAGVYNLGVSGNINTSTNSGTLAQDSFGSVSNCSASGTLAVTGGNVSGGFIGAIYEGVVTSSSSSVNVSYTGTSAISLGAFAGRIKNTGTSSATVRYNTASGNITVTSANASTLILGSFVGFAEIVNAIAMNVNHNTALGNITVSSSTIPTLYMGMVGYTHSGSSTGVLSMLRNSAYGTFSVDNSTVSTTVWIGGIIGNYFGGTGTTVVADSYSMVSIAVTNSGTVPPTHAVGGFIGGWSGSPTTLSIARCYAAGASINQGTWGAGSIKGFIGFPASTTIITSSYSYDNANVPSDTVAGVTNLTTETLMETQGSFTGFTFLQVWKMPTTNPIAAGGVLSPVLYSHCGYNGIVCSGANIVNSSFEFGAYYPVSTGGTFLTPGSAASGGVSTTIMPSWTANNVDWTDGSLWQASNAGKSLDMNSSTPGTASQVFTTVASTSYTIYFDMAGNPAGAPTIKNLRVSVNNAGATFQDYTFDTTGKSFSNMGYVTNSFTFTASGTSTILTFTGMDAGTAYGAVIDNVR